jgi:glycine/D-amino acid oxidase-like deaminating enzyme
MMADLFTPDFKSMPYWWERTPRPGLGAVRLPASADVAVIGSGYTGLCAALEVARGGRSVVVVDAEDAGWGCSTRNGGQISTSIKPDYETLTRRHGAEAAFAVMKEGHNALAWVTDFIAREEIACDFKVPGRFHAAHSPRHYERLARSLSKPPKGLEVPAHVVPRAEQGRELGTTAYCGGVVYEKHASLDPGRFHQGLLAKVLNAGVTVVPHCPVVAIGRDGPGYSLSTGLGKLRNISIASFVKKLRKFIRQRLSSITNYKH